MKKLLIILIVCCSLNGFGQDFFGGKKYVIEQFKDNVFEDKCDTITPATKSDYDKLVKANNYTSVSFSPDTIINCYYDTNRYIIDLSKQHLTINDLEIGGVKYQYDYRNDIAWGGFETYWKSCTIKYYDLDFFSIGLKKMLSNKDNNWVQVYEEEGYWRKKKLSFLKESGMPIKILIGEMDINYQPKEGGEVEVTISQKVIGKEDWKEHKLYRKDVKKYERKNK